MKLVVRRAAAAEAEPLEVFGAEPEGTGELHPPSLGPAAPRRRTRTGVVVAAIACLAASAAGGWFYVRRATAAPALATIIIDSSPSGADVRLAGVSRGRAPLTLRVPPGDQAFTVVSGDAQIPLAINAVAGTTVTQRVVFAPAAVPAAAPINGSLRIVSDPARLSVWIDGVDRGPSPVLVGDLPPGSHRVRLIVPSGPPTDRVVELHAGENASLVLSATRAPAAPEGGWIAVNSPIALRLVEGADVVGTSEAPRTMMAAGSHDLTLANDDLGFRERRKVEISAGKVTTIAVQLPKAPLRINAVPWADVTVDAEHVGETPIGTYAVAIGRHEVVFRHPQLGERRQIVMVGLNTPARASVDFNK